MLGIAQCCPEIVETIGREIRRLMQPILPRTQRGGEARSKVPLRLAKERDIVLRRRIVVSPDQIVRPGSDHRIADGRCNEAGGVRRRNREGRVRAGGKGADGALKVGLGSKVARNSSEI